MRRALVVLVIAAMLLLDGCAGPAPGPTAPLPAPTPAVPCLSQSDDGLFMTCLLTEVDGVWSREFQAAGRKYTSPALTVGRAERPGSDLGPELARERAYFNTLTGIHFPTSYLDDVHTAHGSRAHIVLAFTISHEIGHHVQYSIRPRIGVPEAEVEKQADCYAGFWARREADAHALDIDEFRSGAQAELRRLSEDPEEVRSHGDADQRVASLDKGLGAGDPSVCDIGRLTWR